MAEFTVIPSHPAYSISPLGQVRSERSGILLSHDRQGRVTLRTGDKTLRLYVGELLEMVRPKPERKTKAAPAKTSTPMVMAGKNYRIGCAWPGRPTSICSNWWIGCGPD